MSTNKTPNYSLHSWLGTDEFHVSEVNENFTLLDAALRQETEALKTALEAKVKVLTGAYTGSGQTEPTRVTLGTKPRALIVMMYPTYGADSIRWAVAAPGNTFRDSFTFDDTGFTVRHNGNSLLDLNNARSVYHYIAYC